MPEVISGMKLQNHRADEYLKRAITDGLATFSNFLSDVWSAQPDVLLSYLAAKKTEKLISSVLQHEMESRRDKILSIIQNYRSREGK